MSIKFISPFEQRPGVISDLLKRSYAGLLSCAPQYWSREIENWVKFDQEVFKYPDTVGACVFLTWLDGQIIGLGSFDNRPMPASGIVGHNCILPEYRGRGFGRQQIVEILRRFDLMGILLAKVSTNEHPFFLPARRMYVSCGFRKVGRVPWVRNPELNLIEYEKILG